jgi:hypothetical protein
MNAMPGPAGGLASETQVTTSRRPVRHSRRAAVGPRNPHPDSDGIDVVSSEGGTGLTQNAIVEGNHVLIHSTVSTSGGIGFDGAVKDSLMTANQIEGMSGNAIGPPRKSATVANFICHGSHR